jgi:sodium-independent sulfate anion transporter 11
MVANYNTNTGLSPVQFLVSVAFVSGCIEFLAGILRLGIIVDFISTPVIAGFTSGAAISIIWTQLAGLLGIPGINTNNPAYRVLADTLLSIKLTTVDAAFGIGTITFLFIWRLVAQYLVQKSCRWGVVFGQAGNAIALIFFTLVGLLVNFYRQKPLIRLVGSIPSGINYIALPTLTNMSSVIPASTTVLLVAIMEHIAVTKSFGRVNGYKIKANQEIWALGCVNIIGSFFGGFPATGIAN